jgi:hypothetical protein
VRRLSPPVHGAGERRKRIAWFPDCKAPERTAAPSTVGESPANHCLSFVFPPPLMPKVRELYYIYNDLTGKKAEHSAHFRNSRTLKNPVDEMFCRVYDPIIRRRCVKPANE